MTKCTEFSLLAFTAALLRAEAVEPRGDLCS